LYKTLAPIPHSRGVSFQGKVVSVGSLEGFEIQTLVQQKKGEWMAFGDMIGLP